MKVYIYVTPFFPRPTSWRGAYCLDFVKALKRLTEVECCRSEVERRKVLVFVEGSGEDYEIGGVKVYTFKTRYLPSNIFPFLFKRWNQRSFLNKVESVLDSALNTHTSKLFNEVEVCHCHTANFGVYCEALKRVNPKCKTLLHHHDLQSFGLNNGMLRHFWLYNMIQFPILRRIHEKIDTHVFISEAARRSFLSAPDTSWTQYGEYKKQMRGLPYRPVKIKNSIILHNGVDKNVFKVEKRDGGGQWNCSSSFVIGCVGNFSKLKGQDVLINAVGLIDKPITVKFVGSGETLEECKTLAREQEEKFRSTPTPKVYTFLSEMRHEQLPDFYRSLDLFVLPSWFEGFGCVFTEAHSCGVPFITCEGQGVEDVLEKVGVERGETSPWLCKQRSAEDLARKIWACMSRMGRGERVEQRLSEDQDIDKLVGEFVEEIGL